MKREQNPERIFYDKHGVRISQGDLNWTVATMRKAGDKAAKPGEDVSGKVTYHGTLASACAEAALRMADAGERANLRAYWSDLTEAIADLKAHFREPVESQRISLGPCRIDLGGGAVTHRPPTGARSAKSVEVAVKSLKGKVKHGI